MAACLRTPARRARTDVLEERTLEKKSWTSLNVSTGEPKPPVARPGSLCPPRRRIPNALAAVMLSLGVVACCAAEAAPSGEQRSVNAGRNPISTSQPFSTSAVTEFDRPWALAFLPDSRLLVTERRGRLFLVTQDGRKSDVGGLPNVAATLQNGLLDVAVSPHFATDRLIYFTYSEPAPGSLALARARLDEAGSTPRLTGLQVIWRQSPNANGSFWGGVITFYPEGQHVFLAVRDSSRLSTYSSGAQDPDRDLGKVLRLNLDGSTPRDNSTPGSGTRAQVWTLGHRTAYGLAFAPDGKLWLGEMGPEGGGELNLLEPGANYG